MKKIRCDMMSDDYMRVTFDDDYAFIDTNQGSEKTEIALTPAKIRKLRKQLKRALIEIKGRDAEKAQAEEYNPGDRVYLIEGHNEGDDWCTSPTVVGIDLSVPVELKDKRFDGKWVIEYTDIDGDTENGYAYGKSFGRRA